MNVKNTILQFMETKCCGNEKRISEGRKIIDTLNQFYGEINIINKINALIFKSLVRSIMLHETDTWTLGGHQVSESLSTEMDFRRRQQKNQEKRKLGT